MNEQAVDYDAIVRAEIAIAIINRARGLISTRLHDLGNNDPEGAKHLRTRRRELLALQHAVIVGMPETVEPLITEWGPRVSQEERFWREL